MTQKRFIMVCWWGVNAAILISLPNDYALLWLMFHIVKHDGDLYELERHTGYIDVVVERFRQARQQQSEEE